MSDPYYLYRPLLPCPHCQKPLDNPPDLAGEIVACPYCGGLLQMPVPGIELPRISTASRVTRMARGMRAPRPDDSLKLILGLAGSGLLMIGVFLPLVKVPILGGVDYFRNGTGDGVFILALAGVSILVALFRFWPALWFTAALSLGCLAFTFFNARRVVGEMKTSLEGNPFAGLAEGVSLSYGFPVMAFSAILLIAAATIRAKAR